MVFLRFRGFTKGEISGPEGLATIVIGGFYGGDRGLKVKVHGGLRRMILINNY